MWHDKVPFADAVLRLTGGGVDLSGVKDDVAALRRRDEERQRQAAQAAAEDARRRQKALGWWEEARPIWGTLGHFYLGLTRGLADLPPDISPRVLRFHPNCPFGEGVRHPCLIALFRDIETDEPVAVQRTAIDAAAGKIGRLSMAPTGGAAIKLTDAADVVGGLTIGEGLETVLSGLRWGHWPAWALGSAGEIAKFPVLPGIEVLSIHIENGCEANARAVQTCGERWAKAGREVRLIRPPVGFKDLNDFVMRKPGAKAA